MAADQPLSGVLDRMREAEGDDDVTLGAIVDGLGDRGFGPLLLFPSLIAVLPTGAIPGMGPVTGTLIILFAGQMMLGAARPWVPARLRRVSFGRERFDSGMARAMGWAQKFDKVIRPRLQVLTSGAASKLIAALSVALGLAMFPLSLIPGGNAAAGAAVGLLAIGIVAKDGLVVALGLAASLLAGWFVLGVI